jgi:hypothetical protein
MSLTRDTVLLLVKKFSPGEAPLVDQLESKSVRDGRAAKGPLGFGVELVVPRLAPILWKVVEALYTEALKDLSKAAINKILASLRNNSAQNALETQQLVKKVRDQLIAQGVRLENYPNLAEAIVQTCIQKEVTS